MDINHLLCQLLGKHGPAGDEGDICAFIAQEAEPFCDSITIDIMGNLIAYRKGNNGKKIMFSAHMDSIGLMATHFEESGFVRVGALGGINPGTLLGSTARFKNGVMGVIVKEDKIGLGSLKVEHLLLDIGATDQEEAQSMITPGDTAVVVAPPVQLGGKRTHLISPYLDNRVSCGILLAVMEQFATIVPENDLYFVFSAQEEVGRRGAGTAAYQIAPDYGIAVDVTGVCDTQDSLRNGTCKLGEGAGIKIMDQSVICHPDVVKCLETLAKEGDIKAQRDILKAGGTDAGSMIVSRGGVKTGGISVPCRYIHSPGEMVAMDDVDACIRLSAAFANASL